MPFIPEEKRALTISYVAQYEERYLMQPKGQWHIVTYDKERTEVRKYWEETKKAKQAGQDITDLVLGKLLPYSNTRNNREKGYRISITPAIIKDIRKWFENAGWQKAENWGKVAEGIYNLIYGLVENNDWSGLAAFEQNHEISRGIKSGFITPTLFFLDSTYRIINKKTIDTIRFILDRKAIDRDLTNYHTYIEIINKTLEELALPLFADYEKFDAFCHWMCIKELGGYARLEKTAIDEEAIEEDDDETPTILDEIEPQNHWEAIHYIVKTGELLGYKTYVADPSRTAFDKKLGDIATLKEVPTILQSAPNIDKVDVIWYKAVPPFFFFEVEDGGTMRDALHRLYNAIAFDARFFIVCPMGNFDKYQKWVRTAPFSEYEERYNFRTYQDLFGFYQEVLKYTAMKERFLKI
jgi:hypothetical protein